MILSKLKTSLDSPVSYVLGKDTDAFLLNDLLGKKIKLSWTGIIECVKCQKHTKKSFGEGFCFTCFQSAPESSPCILRPELCRAHLGEGRDLVYETTHHLQPHIVYLALTDVVKVGVTRKTQVPTRWIDQGAAAAIILAETQNRYQAGMLEVAMKELYTDKTNWRKMLLNTTGEEVDLSEEKWQAHDQMPSDLANFWVENDDITHINYPVLIYPELVNSLTFDSQPNIEGVLTGIRGQYLYLDEKNVLNIRRHSGYEIAFNA